MQIELGFGTTGQSLNVPDENLIGVLVPNEVPASLTGEEEVLRALDNPIESRRLREIVKPGERIVIVSSDITRPMPTRTVMPPLLDELYAAGVRAEDITLVLALGSHREHSDEERRKLAGERAWNEITVTDSRPNDTVHLGVTSMGTPVDIDRRVAEADRRICLGNIEYHYFAGYSGGAKAIMPGVSTPEAIRCNHSHMTDPGSFAGNLDTNPVRKDIEEAASICGIDFILNVVLDEHKQIVYAVAGDPVKAHRAGCRYIDRLYQVEIEEKADIVVVSQGGAPKDLNLYQTQKALDNAKHAVRPGGVIILVGSCREGAGNSTFESWMTEASSPEELISRIRTDFRLGGHKAAAIAMVLRDADIYLVSEMEPEYVSQLFMKPFSDVRSALDCAFEKLGKDAGVLVMPYGGSTLPKVKQTL